jgi:outer membrane immunogenic protein
MSRTLLCSAALAIALAASPALAADFGVRPAYGVAPAYGPFTWTGFYVGANLGYAWGTITNANLNHSGFAGGVQGGYNWQAQNIVFGGEADLQLSSAEDSAGAFKFSNPWFGTLRGRVGYAMNNILVYATGGFAYGGGEVDVGAASESHTAFGWTVGGGLEVALTPHWSAKAEYLYVDLTGQNYAVTGFSHEVQTNVLRLGGNYRF